MSIPIWTVGDRMRKALEHSGTSVYSICDALEISRSTASNWMHGRRQPPRAALIVWAMRTGVPLEWIVIGGCDKCGEWAA